jgi:hypothetical protein
VPFHPELQVQVFGAEQFPFPHEKLQIAVKLIIIEIKNKTHASRTMFH